jgi:hypothetical protein
VSVLRRAYVEVEPDVAGFDEKLREKFAKADPGGKAGKQLGGQLNRALKRLDLDAIDIKGDPKKALAAMGAVEARLQALSRNASTVEIKVRAEAALKEVGRFRKQLGEIGNDPEPARNFVAKFAEQLTTKLGALPMTGMLSVPVAAAGAAAAPLLGAAIAGGIIGGAGIGGVIGGIKLASKDTRVKAAAEDLGDRLEKRLYRAGGAFVQPALDGLNQVQRTLDDIDLESILEDSAKLVPILTGGISSALVDLGAGLADLVENAGPPVQAISDGIARIGESVSAGLSSLADNADGSADALRALFGIVAYGVNTTLLLVNGLTELYEINRAIGGDTGLRLLLKLTGAEIDKTGESARRTGADTSAMGQNMIQAAESAEALKAKQAALKAVQDQVSVSQQALTTTLDGLGGKTGFASQAAQALTTAMDNLYGATQRQGDANQAFEASWDSLSEGIKKNKGSLDIHTAAGRANRDTLKSLVGVTNEAYIADINAGMAIDKARQKHDNRIRSIDKEASKLGLNRAETKKLIDTYGQIPPNKTTDLVLDGVREVVRALTNLYIYQRALAEGKSIASIEQKMRTGSDSGPAKRFGGFRSGGRTGDMPEDAPAGVVHGREFVVNAPTVRRIDRQAPGFLDELHATGQLPGYARGGRVAPVDTSRRWPFVADMSDTFIMSRKAAAAKVVGAPGSFGAWPSSPSAQRGDSGVWKKVAALIRSTGPLSGSFGNGYRPGDPKWHGCVPMDTRILTRRGWITYGEVVVGSDETIGYNPATGKNEWTLIVGLHRYEDAEVWKLQNAWFTAEVTPGHKWLVDHQVSVQTETACTECGREFATRRGMAKHRADVCGVRTPRRERFEEQLVATRDFKQSTRIHLSKPADLGEQLPITDDEAELIGWIFGDGYMEPNGPTIVQSKPEEVRYLKGFMAQFPCGEYVRAPEGQQNFTVFRWKLAKDYWDDLASRSKASKGDALNFVFSLSPSQRAAFVRGFLSADGTRDTRTQDDKLGYAAFQVSGPVAEGIKVAAYLEGYRPDTRVKTEFDDGRFGAQPMEHIGFRMPVVRGRNLPVVARRTADVWCPTTTLGTWTARQGEEIFLTGNSGRAVDWMGYNQDALASFLAARRPLELIHRTRNRDYAYTRGKNKGSFNNALMEAHRNHIHIAMDDGGMRMLQPGMNIIPNFTGKPEPIAGPNAMAALSGDVHVHIAPGAIIASKQAAVALFVEAFNTAKRDRLIKT